MVDHLISNIDTKTGWIGPPGADPADGNSNFAAWIVLTGLLQWQEGMNQSTRIMPLLYAHLHESYRRLTAVSPLVAWSQSRYQDYVWLLQAIVDSDPTDSYGEKSFLTAFMWVLVGQQNVVWEEYYESPFFPTGNTGWNFSNHGVNVAEGLKSGSVLYRLTGSPFAVESTYSRMALLDYYHGSPHGTVLADETMSESMPSHGIELCLVVETMFSLNVMHEALGDAAFAERAEKVAYNALPGTWDTEMWAHQYLQQPNSYNAIHLDDHVWLADGSDATTFGLAPNYPCCTANGPQGWPRFVPRMMHRSQDGAGIALSILGPLTADIQVNGGVMVSVIVDTQYPFGDDLNITITNAPANMPFYLRIPTWALTATIAIDGQAPISVGSANGTMYEILLPAGGGGGGQHTIQFALNPQIYVDSVGLLYNGAIAVHRGALLYGMHLEETVNITATWNTTNPSHPTGNDFSLNSTSTWNVALVFDPSDPAGPSKFFTFSQTAALNSTFPYDHSTPSLQITAMAREVPSWISQQNAPAAPPSSPACSGGVAVSGGGSASCGTPFQVTLYPYGMTHIRMSVLPWTPT